MTAVLPPLTEPDFDEAQLLFQEAKQRRKRRWLVSGIVAAIVVLLIGITLFATAGRGGGGPVRPVPNPVAAGVVVHSAAGFSMRPVLCYAPPLTPAAGQPATAGPLPTCSAASQLTAANLQVTPNSSNVNGYTSNTNIQPDTQFATYKSTPSTSDAKGDTVLLPGVGAASGSRYVLGPAQLTGTGVKSARAQLNNGVWDVNLQLTPQGSAAWDTLAFQQFHAIVAVDLDGRVVSAPITSPTASAPSSFNGQVPISGNFTRAQAEALAARF
jgi:hypothetical protein